MSFEEMFSKAKDLLAKADASGIREHLAYQFNITGEAHGIFYVEVKDGAIFVEPYEYYDRDIIELAVKEMRGDIEKLSAFDGQLASPFDKMMYPLGKGNANMKNALFEMEKSIMVDLALTRNCVIVGRCSDYILSERDDCVHVFIYADNDYRAERILRLYGDNGVKIEKRMKDKDSQRISYYEHYTNRDWGNPLNYHLCLNSGFIGDELCAEMIIKAAQK